MSTPTETKAAPTLVAATDSRTPNYRRNPISLVRGEGSRLYDTAGKCYVDFLSGIGVNALGHAHPRLVAALREQLGQLVHVSNLYDHPLQNELCQRLARACGLDLVFLTNSGTEAWEAALKVSRLWQRQQCRPQQTGFLALENAFHGRTLGSLSMTWDAGYREPFLPLVPGCDFVKPNDVDALAKALRSRRYAAFGAEPIQGESGIRPLDPGYLHAARELTRETGTLLVLDEIQSGAGRTGDFLASRLLTQGGVQADVVTLAKPIGGGLPIGATVMSRAVGEAMQPGTHGSTFAGGALACRAGLVFMDELEKHGLLERVRVAGARLRQGLEALVRAHAIVESARGYGLMQAIVLKSESAPVAKDLLANGLLASATGKVVLRFLPPYVITDDEIDSGLAVLDRVLSQHSSASAARGAGSK